MREIQRTSCKVSVKINKTREKKIKTTINEKTVSATEQEKSE